jgi:hypothetical protein
MYLEDCIPKDKFDHDAVKRASEIGYPGINAILPDLLVWLQDRTWPVAPDVARLLERAGTGIAPHISAILNSRDSQWKYGVLIELGPSLDGDVWRLIEVDVIRLIDAPTKQDISDEVHTMAAEVFQNRVADGQSATMDD